MVLSKNLLFSTLGSQITMDFVWKLKAAIHSFTLNFVKLLYPIIWEARTNLIRFYWNLHHIEHLTWISEQFFVHHNFPRSSGWIKRSNNGRALHVEKNIPGLQAEVSLMMLSKNLLFNTLGFQITNDFVRKSNAGNLLIYLNFCQATLNHNIYARANLIRFYWNLHHLVHLTWIIL